MDTNLDLNKNSAYKNLEPKKSGFADKDLELKNLDLRTEI
jgi:hypothetical protein